MPSAIHEGLIEVFRHRPAFAAEVITELFNVDVPAWQHARLDAGDLPELTPTEYRADVVVTLLAGQRAVLAVIAEIQLRPDVAKRRTWPVYLTTLHARLRCPVVLLVVSPDIRCADWCAQPIHIGHPDWELRPLVLGPRQVPVITEAAEAAGNPELSLLSAVAHGENPQRDKIFDSFLRALQTVEDERASLYADLVLAALPAATRHHLEALMSTGTYEYQSDFARRYFSEGKAEGKAEGEIRSLLAVLAARGFDVPAAARERIKSCTDLDQLEEWITRAVTIGTVDELFG
jgi:hypothetical protein